MEKFYDYIELLQYLIDNFFTKHQIKLNGITLAVGEEDGDATYIVIQDNKIYTFDAMDENVSTEICSSISKVGIIKIFHEIRMEPEDIRSEYWDYTFY